MEAASSVKLIQGRDRANISLNGRLLYSETSTPEKRVEGLPQTPEAVYLVISPLLFHGIENLLNQIPESSALVAVETDAELYRISRKIHTDKKFSFEYRFLGEHTSDFIAGLVKKHRCRKLIPVKLNKGYMLNRRYYDSLVRDAESYIANYWKNRITTIHMGRLWSRNILLNISSASRAKPFSALRTEKTVLCAGAGESLEQSIPFIKANRQSFFITAVDTALTSLLLNDIRPDLIIVLEAQHANLYDFYEVSSFDLPVAADMTSSPELIRKLRGPVYFFISRFEHTRLFGRMKSFNLLPPVIPPLGSVGISSVVLSQMLTTQNVVCTGLDFSFLPDKYHASGSPSSIINQMNENRFSRTGFFSSAYGRGRYRTSDISGRSVYTDLVMKSYSETLKSVTLGSDRIFSFAGTGLDSGLAQLSEAQLTQLIEFPAAGSKPPPEDANHPADFMSKDNGIMKLFIEGELKLLLKATEETVDHLNAGRDSADLPEELALLLTDLDYTWLFFPDKKPLPSADSSFLRRFLYSAAWFKSQAERALSLL